ncbi:MAG: hypothetical protein ABTQ25_18785 [Nitrosomonas ureae]
MKNFLLTLSFVVFSGSSFATGNFNSETGYLIIRNLNVDGTTAYDSVNVQLNLATGTFTILDTTLDSIETEINPFSRTPIDTFISDNIKVDFMGCNPTVKDSELKKHQIMCETQVTSLNGDEKIWSGLNKLIDILGNEYFRQATVIALDKPAFRRFKTIQGIPVSVKYVFNGIDFGATISAFEPSIYIRETPTSIQPNFPINIKLSD